MNYSEGQAIRVKLDDGAVLEGTVIDSIQGEDTSVEASDRETFIESDRDGSEWILFTADGVSLLAAPGTNYVRDVEIVTTTNRAEPRGDGA